MIKFYPVTDTKYISGQSYELIKASSSAYRLLKDGKFTELEFSSVQDAQNYVNCAREIMPAEKDDFEFVCELYQFKPLKNGKWKAELDDADITATLDDENRIQVDVESKDHFQVKHFPFKNIIDFIDLLDLYQTEPLFACTLLPHEVSRKILAASSNIKDLTSQMIRVKSSNMWAYRMDVKDRKSGIGDLFIQFKGKNGGPEDVYVYYDVPITVWKKFVTAPSKGHFFWVNIRNNYLYRKLTGDRKTRLRNGIN